MAVICRFPAWGEVQCKMGSGSNRECLQSEEPGGFFSRKRGSSRDRSELVGLRVYRRRTSSSSSSLSSSFSSSFLVYFDRTSFCFFLDLFSLV